MLRPLSGAADRANTVVADLDTRMVLIRGDDRGQFAVHQSVDRVTRRGRSRCYRRADSAQMPATEIEQFYVRK